MRRCYLYFIITCCIFFSSKLQSFSQSEKHYIRDGNKQFRNATIDPKKVDSLKYKSAEQAYKNALDEKPDSYEATYNLGNAYYRQKKFKDAITQYKIAANKNMPKKEQAWNYHNMGNTLMQSGQLQECIESYKNALKNNPHDKETKYNLAYAQYMLKKQQQQQKKDQKNDKNKDQDKDKQDKQDKKDQQQNQDKQDQQQDQKQAQKKDQISKEDAQRMLEAMQNDEKKTQEKVKKQQVKTQRVRIEKDW